MKVGVSTIASTATQINKLSKRLDSLDIAIDSLDNNNINNNEQDVSLKGWLAISPEERYQHFKENWFLHEMSYLHQTVDENGKAVDIVKDYGCGHWSNKSEEGWCVPECRYYRKYGRIEDQEMIAYHNKWAEYEPSQRDQP